jgi:hypothetical protein
MAAGMTDRPVRYTRASALQEEARVISLTGIVDVLYQNTDVIDTLLSSWKISVYCFDHVDLTSDN